MKAHELNKMIRVCSASHAGNDSQHACRNETLHTSRGHGCRPCQTGTSYIIFESGSIISVQFRISDCCFFSVKNLIKLTAPKTLETLKPCFEKPSGKSCGDKKLMDTM